MLNMLDSIVIFFLYINNKMDVTKDILDFFNEKDTFDPITFFTWMGYRHQNDKREAHSKYQTLISLAEESVEWRATAVLMAEQWQSLHADGTIANLEEPPKEVFEQKGDAGAGRIRCKYPSRQLLM